MFELRRIIVFIFSIVKIFLPSLSFDNDRPANGLVDLTIKSEHFNTE